MTQHIVKQGECLSGIADQYRIPLETIWMHSENAALRSIRGKQDILYPGDALHIPDLTKHEETCAVEQRHRFRRTFSVGLIVRLEIDPENPASEDDRFVLEATDGSYKSEKTIADDQIPDDEFVDLHYSGMGPRKRYTLSAYSGDAAEPDIVFSDVPYEELTRVSAEISDDPEASESDDDANEDSDIDEEQDDQG